MRSKSLESSFIDPNYVHASASGADRPKMSVRDTITAKLFPNSPRPISKSSTRASAIADTPAGARAVKRISVSESRPSILPASTRVAQHRAVMDGARCRAQIRRPRPRDRGAARRRPVRSAPRTLRSSLDRYCRARSKRRNICGQLCGRKRAAMPSMRPRFALVAREHPSVNYVEGDHEISKKRGGAFGRLIALCCAAGRSPDESTLVLVLGGEAYDGAPEFEVSFDGTPLGTGAVETAIDTETIGRIADVADKSPYVQSFEFRDPGGYFPAGWRGAHQVHQRGVRRRRVQPRPQSLSRVGRDQWSRGARTGLQDRVDGR